MVQSKLGSCKIVHIIRNVGNVNTISNSVVVVVHHSMYICCNYVFATCYSIQVLVDV